MVKCLKFVFFVGLVFLGVIGSDGAVYADGMTDEGVSYTFPEVAEDKIVDIPDFSFSEIEPKKIWGPDERRPVSNTTVFPYSAVVKVVCHYNVGLPSSGTGSMIGKDAVLTNAHVVYSKDRGWPKSITVYPGKNANSEPFGSAQSRVVTISSTSYGATNDYAVIRLNKAIGNNTGYFGLTSTIPSSLTLTGYHGDKKDGKMYTQTSSIVGSNNEQILHQFDAWAGSSGSPMYNSNKQIVAIHAGGYSSYDYAVRMNGKAKSNVVAWAHDKNSDGTIYTGVNYQTHTKNFGWMNFVANGTTSGTTKQSRQAEALQIKLSGYSGGIQYRSHVQSKGWLPWVSNGQTAGTVGESRRLEAFQVKLTGAIANTHRIEYRAHVQSKGWLPWVKDGQTAGTVGEARQVEAIEMRLVKK
ncbi:trypsin-like serine protease [Enterococcus sp. LJL128]